MGNQKVYLFVHLICCVTRREPLLAKPVRAVLFSSMQKNAAEKGIRIQAINGVEDHMHCLLQLLPSQNLSQVARQVMQDSARWMEDNKLLEAGFGWEEDYTAYSVSPSQVQQVIDYIARQEEHHKTKSLESELEIVEKIRW